MTDKRNGLYTINFFKVDGENAVYVRGVTSITDVEEKFYVTMRIALLSLPLMLVVTVLAGFYFYRTNTSSGEADDQCGEEDSGRRKSVRKNRA